MSHLISKLLLAMWMIPVGVFVYLFTFIFLESFRSPLGFRMSEDKAMLLSGALAWAFVAVYWYWLWARSVRWTKGRSAGTLAVTFASIAAAGLVYLAMMPINYDVAAFMASIAAPIAWVAGTILVWRDRPIERTARMEDSAGVLVCPTCGYNLTGLSESRCPECGSKFTLNELLARQPARENAEIER